MIALAPERDDFWRVRSTADARAPFKEWQHFIVVAPGLDLLVNFSLANGVGRVIVLAHAATWTGFVETCTADISRDGCHARFGEHRVEITAGGYRISIDAPAHGVHIDATFRPQVLPITARRQRIAPGRHLDWSLTARLAVVAHVELPGATFEISDGLGYHDHNWGDFHWGDDFTWEWGSVLPTDGGDWAIVYSNLMNRARTQLALEQLFVWRGERNVLAAGGAEVCSRLRGRFRGEPSLRMPPVMSLLRSRLGGDTPQRVELAATCDRGEVLVRFTPTEVSHVLVPSERSLRGVIAIHECVGAVDVEGRIGDDSIIWEGRGVFEFVR